MGRIYAIFLFLVFAHDGYIERFSYAEKSTLDWTDFRGTPDHSSEFDASVNTGITYQWSYSSQKKGTIELNYEVNSFCYPTESWVKKGYKSYYLLSHEQLHFDISELHARIMRKRLQEYKPGKNIKRDLNKMYKLVERMRINMQEQYDIETDHSRNRENQKKWEKKIKTLIKYYQAYAVKKTEIP